MKCKVFMVYLVTDHFWKYLILIKNIKPSFLSISRKGKKKKSGYDVDLNLSCLAIFEAICRSALCFQFLFYETLFSMDSENLKNFNAPGVKYL